MKERMEGASLNRIVRGARFYVVLMGSRCSAAWSWKI